MPLRAGPILTAQKKECTVRNCFDEKCQTAMITQTSIKTFKATAKGCSHFISADCARYASRIKGLRIVKPTTARVVARQRNQSFFLPEKRSRPIREKPQIEPII